MGGRRLRKLSQRILELERTLERPDYRPFWLRWRNQGPGRGDNCQGQMLGGARQQEPGIWGYVGPEGQVVRAPPGLRAQFSRSEGLASAEGSPPELLRGGQAKSKVDA